MSVESHETANGCIMPRTVHGRAPTHPATMAANTAHMMKR